MTEHKPTSLLALTLILGSVTIFSPIATDMYLPAVSDIAQSYGAPLERVQMTLAVFFLGIACGQLVYGPIIDHFGRRLPLLIGVAGFTLCSALLAHAPNIEIFTVLRFLQPLFGCGGMVVGRAVIHDLYDERRGASALAQLFMIIAIGPIVAPALGALLLNFFAWPALFWAQALVGAGAFVAVAAGLRETLPAAARSHRRLAEIFRIYARLLGAKNFLAPCLTSAAAMAALFAFIGGSQYVYMELRGFSRDSYALIFAGNAFGLMGAAQLNRILLRRFAPRQILLRAVAYALAANGLLFALTPVAPDWALILLPYFCLAASPLISVNATVLAMGQSGGHGGSASALIGVAQFVAAGLAMVLVSLLSAGDARAMTGVMLAGAASAAGVAALALRRPA